MQPIDRIINKMTCSRPNYTPKDKDLALINKNPRAIYYYAINILKKPYEKGEKILAKNSRYSMYYLQKFRKKLTQDRIELLESAICKNAQDSYEYADSFIHKRFEKGEKAISKDSDVSTSYAQFVINGRFELGEDAISKNIENSLDYAKLIKGRFELGEDTIAKDGYSVIRYVEIIKDRFPKGEKTIKKEGLWDAYIDTVAESMIIKSDENKQRILDKKIENHIVERKHDICGYSSYERLIKSLIIDNIHDGNKIIEEYSDLPFFDKLITSISKQQVIPVEVNNYMIAKGLMNSESSKAYLKNQNLFKQKIKNFLKQYSGKTVDELVLIM